ncbi:hypothetical protein MPER_12157 [Moniliophthora perniciosa FA553]|nr:hypothetical protein MPER_12157 [Moniliophthora perniciosa FA553]
MSSAGQDTPSFVWNADIICIASTKVSPVIPVPSGPLTCTPTLYDVPNKPLKHGADSKNYYILMERDGGSRNYQQGIYRDYQAIKRQLPNEMLDGSSAIVQGFETLDEAKDAWKTRCTQIHTSPAHTSRLQALFDGKWIHPITGRIIRSLPPASPRRQRQPTWHLYLASTVGVYECNDLKQAYSALTVAGEDNAAMLLALSHQSAADAWEVNREVSDDDDNSIASSLAGMSVH